MMKKVMFFFIVFIFSQLSFGEPSSTTVPQNLQGLEEKIGNIENQIKKIAEDLVKQQKEMEELKQEIEQLKETNVQFSRILRNLEIYVKSVSSIRPEMSDWESIKAGMSMQEVEDILGQPEAIKEEKRVGTTWYYYGLGSITFNEKGFVRNRKTFKQFPIER